MIRILVTAVPLIVGGVIFFDAKKSVKPLTACMIACCCSFFFPFGPLLYLSFRSRLLKPSRLTPLFCPKCGHNAYHYQKKCSKCKNSLTL